MDKISISKENFMNLKSTDAKLDALFDCIVSLERQLIKKSRREAMLAGIGGIIGGMVSGVGIRLPGWFQGGK